MIVAIDGLAGSGKGTLARKLAIHLRLPHLDSGKLYRQVALLADDLGIDPSQTERLAALLEKLDVSDLDNPRLSSGRAGALAARYSKLSLVRDKISSLIRNFPRSGGGVVDGRDIGTVVLPDANIKLYITASPEVRAQRRVAELRAIGHEVSFNSILDDLVERDRADIERTIAPLRPASDAHLLDTTHLSVDATFNAALAIIEAAELSSKRG